MYVITSSQSSTLQTDGRTDRPHTITIPRYAHVRASRGKKSQNHRPFYIFSKLYWSDFYSNVALMVAVNTVWSITHAVAFIFFRSSIRLHLHVFFDVQLTAVV